MYDDLFSLTLCKKLLKTFKKNCFNSHDGWEKTLYLGIAAEGYRQNTELSRCIFQISLKYIELVVPKILFILVLCRFNFYFKIMLTPPPPPPPQKIKSRAEEILFDTSKQNTKKLKCFELKWSAKHIKFIGKIKQQFNKNINKHSITSAKWGQ